MMIIYDLIGLIVFGLIAWGIVSAVNWGRTRLDKNRLRVGDLRKQLTDAERTLRHIANGQSGNPELEASIALDEIERFYENKELS
jgi:hypothetical protein